MFQKFLLTIFAIILGIMWVRFLFTKKSPPSNPETVANKKGNWFSRKKSPQMEVLEPCEKCGVYFSKTGAAKTCSQCQRKS